MLPLSDNLQQLDAISTVEGRPLSRSFDVFCAALGLLLLSPLLLLIALVIKVGDGGPVFYRQQRMGKNFRSFKLLKFRTMLVGADRNGLLTAPGDPRITRVGSLLRKCKLDELPQLFNVLTGEMQLVGARPEVAKYVEMMRPQYELILREPPGVTDPASIAFRHEERFLSSSQIEQQYLSEILPKKIRLSLEYQARRTFFSDVRILFQTVLGLG